MLTLLGLLAKIKSEKNVTEFGEISWSEKCCFAKTRTQVWPSKSTLIKKQITNKHGTHTCNLSTRDANKSWSLGLPEQAG